MAHSEDELQKYRVVFDQFDVNGDGWLSHEELRTALEALGHRLLEQDFQHFLASADTENSGKITFDGFVTAVNNRPTRQQNLAKIRRLFRVMDTDGSGFITLKDLRTLVKESGAEMPEEELKQIILKVDQDGDKKVSFEEFAAHVGRRK